MFRGWPTTRPENDEFICSVKCVERLVVFIFYSEIIVKVSHAHVVLFPKWKVSLPLHCGYVMSHDYKTLGSQFTKQGNVDIVLVERLKY
jgi:hypothetical protein